MKTGRKTNSLQTGILLILSVQNIQLEFSFIRKLFLALVLLLTLGLPEHPGKTKKTITKRAASKVDNYSTQQAF
jgi:hypothetical protein